MGMKMKKVYYFSILITLFFLRNASADPEKIYFVSNGGSNAGDYYCSPELYYDFENYQVIKINTHKLVSSESTSELKLKDAIIIFGGGGIIDVTKRMNSFYKNLDPSNKCFHWGSGSNRLNPEKTHWELNTDEIEIKDDTLKNFILVGRRDYLDSYYENHTYVPCVSCKLPYLKLKYKIKRRIGVVDHMSIKINKRFKFPRISMNLDKFKIDEIIKFIGESEIIITSSFHAAYWALLLNKKVIINKNWSSKFDTLKYQPALFSGNLERDIRSCIVPPADYLKECIELNDAFYQRVMSSIQFHKTRHVGGKN